MKKIAILLLILMQSYNLLVASCCGDQREWYDWKVECFRREEQKRIFQNSFTELVEENPEKSFEKMDDTQDQSPLWIDAGLRYFHPYREDVEKLFDKKLVDSNGNNLLHKLIENREYQFALLFVERLGDSNKGELDISNNYEKTPLDVAIECGIYQDPTWKSLVETLCEKKASFHTQTQRLCYDPELKWWVYADKNPKTMLGIACELNSFVIGKYYFDCLAFEKGKQQDVQCADDIRIPSVGKDPRLFYLLCEKGFKNKSKDTIFHAVARYGTLVDLHAKLEKYGDKGLHAKNINGHSVLDLAVEVERSDLYELFFRKNVLDKDKNTALHCALKHSAPKELAELKKLEYKKWKDFLRTHWNGYEESRLEQLRSCTIRNKEKEKELKHLEDILKLLRQSWREKDSELLRSLNSKGETVLDVAIKYVRDVEREDLSYNEEIFHVTKEIFEKLCDEKIGFSTSSKHEISNKNLLHIAAEFGSLKIAQYYFDVSEGKGKDHVDNYEETPLDLLKKRYYCGDVGRKDYWNLEKFLQDKKVSFHASSGGLTTNYNNY